MTTLNNELSATSTASLRAPNGFHLPDIMQKGKELFLKFGGHPQAAGFSAETKNLTLIKQLFLSEINKPEYQNLKEPISSEIVIEDYRQINQNLFKEIFLLEPFGLDFPMPTFVFNIMSNKLKSRKLIGKKFPQTHIKIVLDNDMNLTFFNLGDDEIKTLLDLNAVGGFKFQAKFSQNVWNNSTKYELIGIGFKFTPLSQL
jgi:single-stranded-DNA-specific exonuclease